MSSIEGKPIRWLMN